ncbi:hypothetical protein DE146DRAFT_755264 [Phaeosphaeria sp. MPI-PUGE-AT-0046c]|nr:hypothetical protein DE146DRAFT_755264 [Phaeosphaeria sp. MPI-PUGE-AT-0046c]
MARRRHHRRQGSDEGGVPVPHLGSCGYSSVTSTSETPSTSEVSSSEHEDSYFNKFEGFQQDRDATFAKEFARLAIHQEWSKKEKKERRFEAVEAEIELYVGTDMSDLKMLQKVCGACDIDPIPSSVTKCKKALATVHVNIYNFVEHCRHPSRVSVRTFQSLNQLRKYSVPNYIFPLSRAKADKFIKVLLRPFFGRRRK